MSNSTATEHKPVVQHQDHCPACGGGIGGIAAFAESGCRDHVFEPCGHRVPEDFALAAGAGGRR